MNPEILSTASHLSPEFVSLLSEFLQCILVILLSNLAFIAGLETMGRMQGRPGLGIELFLKEINFFINLFFPGK